jgi:hypothetical protein
VPRDLVRAMDLACGLACQSTSIMGHMRPFYLCAVADMPRKNEAVRTCADCGGRSGKLLYRALEPRCARRGEKDPGRWIRQGHGPLHEKAGAAARALPCRLSLERQFALGCITQLRVRPLDTHSCWAAGCACLLHLCGRRLFAPPGFCPTTMLSKLPRPRPRPPTARFFRADGQRATARSSARLRRAASRARQPATRRPWKRLLILL